MSDIDYYGACPTFRHCFRMLRRYLWALVLHGLQGFRHVSSGEKSRRQAECQACEFYQPDKDRCGKCGCTMKTKASWKTSQCPIGKW